MPTGTIVHFLPEYTNRKTPRPKPDGDKPIFECRSLMARTLVLTRITVGCQGSQVPDKFDAGFYHPWDKCPEAIARKWLVGHGLHLTFPKSTNPFIDFSASACCVLPVLSRQPGVTSASWTRGCSKQGSQ